MATRKKAAVKTTAPQDKVLIDDSARVETPEPLPEPEVSGKMLLDRPPEKPRDGVRKISVKYSGGGYDHSVAPGVHVIGKDGKPIKRRYVKPPVTKYFEIETYKLWGFEFPKDELVEIFEDNGLFRKGQVSLHMLTQKLVNLRLFDVDAPEEFMQPLPKKTRRR